MRMGHLSPSLIAIAFAFAGFLCGSQALAQSAPAAGAAVPSDPVGTVTAARRRVAAGDLDGAIRTLAQYVAAHPREVAPARYLGDLYYRQADLQSAERTYLSVLRFAPGDLETHNRLGGLYAVEDRTKDAIDEFTRSLPDIGAYGHLVDLHRRVGDLPLYEAALKRDADSRPFDAVAQYAMGAVYRAAHRPAEAVAYLERSLQGSPRACPPLAELGSAYLDLGNTTKAIETLDLCLSLQSDDYPALVNLSDAYIALGQYDKARQQLEHAEKVRPEGAEALVNMGYLEDTEQRWQSAVQYYLRAIGTDPLVSEAYVNLGYDYGQQKLYPQAEAAYLKGLSVSPNDGRLHFLLGSIYADQGKRDLARAEFQRASESDEPEISRAAASKLAVLK